MVNMRGMKGLGATDFYEEDEDVTGLLAAFEQSPKTLTARPQGQILPSGTYMVVTPQARRRPRKLHLAGALPSVNR